MNSAFNSLPDTTVDSIMLANARWPEFQKQHDNAINTTIGVLLDPLTSLPWQPQTVIEARRQVLGATTKQSAFGYQPQVGYQDFIIEAGKLVFNESIYANNESDIDGYQTLGGTGSLSLVEDTLQALLKPNNQGQMPLLLDAGWPNHPAIFRHPFAITTYAHLHPRTGTYNHHAAVDALAALADKSVILFQTCGYNDDGADRSQQEWDELLTLAQKRSAIVILDTAYIGLAQGVGLDRYPIEQCFKRGLFSFICVSFSKNMGLYNERVGALFIANAKLHLGAKQARYLNQLVQRNVRRTISSPPRIAAQAAAQVLQQAAFYDELESARRGIIANRQALARLVGPQVPTIESGYGLFTKLFAGGFSNQAQELLAKNGVLVLPNARLNLGGMRLDQTERLGRILQRVLSLG